MINLSIDRCPRFARFLLGLCFAGSLFAAEPARQKFDVPAGEASATLRQFAAQSGQTVVYLVETVRGVRTSPIQGELTARDALNRMLAGTELVLVQDEKSGALTISRVSDPNAPRAAQVAKASDRPEARVPSKNEVVTLDDYAVTGSRLTLNAGESPMQPVLTYTARDIERLGLSNLGQLFQFVPAVTAYTSGSSIERTDGSAQSGAVGPTQGRVSAQLRGGTQTATLLLIDGKRAPLTGQQNSNNVGFDLGGIPLSAVERVEVLLDGASAIYGADAIYGVINVILKKRYSGSEVRLTYDNTFDKDAGHWTASITHGFSRGRWAGLFTAALSENNIALLADRELTASFDRTLYGGSFDNSTPTLRLGATGNLNVVSGTLPGLTTNVAGIPANSNGQNLTVADYAAAGVPTGGIPTGRQGMQSYRKERSGYFRLGYEICEGVQVTAHARMGYSQQRDNGQYRRAQNVLIPAGYPGNPFGVPVRLSKIFYDLPPLSNENINRSSEAGITLDGKLPGEWRYEVSANYSRGVSKMIPDLYEGMADEPTLQMQTGAVTAAVAAGRQPMVIYDSSAHSGDPAALMPLFASQFGSLILNDVSATWTYAAQANGRLFSLPAGDVRAVIGLEHSKEKLTFPGAEVVFVWEAFPPRKVTAAFAEVRVPVFAPRQNLPLLQQLDLNLAFRGEEHVRGGRNTTPRYGLAWKPAAFLLFRGSYGEGFLVPELYRTAEEAFTSPGTFTASMVPIDSLRGNQNLIGQTYLATFGGNPNLRPQRSENWTYGAVIEVPKLKGLSLSLDYFDNQYFDRFGNVTLLGDRILYAPQTITRGPNLPGDAAGWAGPIIAIDRRTTNIALARVSGYDFGIRWDRTTAWGDFSIRSSGEKITRDVAQVIPNAIPSVNVHRKYRPLRITTSLLWSRDAWNAGITSVHGGRYWSDTSNAVLSPSRWTDDVTRWDVNASYDFGRSRGFGGPGDTWWRRALHDTKWSVTIVNVFDTEPPLEARGTFSSSIIDMRLRRYVIDFTKRF